MPWNIGGLLLSHFHNQPWKKDSVSRLPAWPGQTSSDNMHMSSDRYQSQNSDIDIDRLHG